ncbi:hypothetical protein DPMN_014483 [Dreissena polymorpha]|uniref:Uncharacterized protein n=1 Tax=Dreissena polymorpha TaxID=45954 RepID=A0A9D4S595_DREPO|nr:hypothetical protein DPMN_014483 [Dreissena polymorpha]
MAVLILLCGDVETNPGPPKQDGTRNKSQVGKGQYHDARYKKVLLQDSGHYLITLHVHHSKHPVNSLKQDQRQQDQSKSNNESDMFVFLRNMKIDIGNQNGRLIKNIEGIYSKIDQLFTSVNDLKHDNERLRQYNEHLREEMHYETKIRPH